VGLGAPKTYAATEHNPFDVAVDATTVYWVDVGPNSSGDPQNPVFTSGTIMSCPRAGCPAAGPTVLAQNLAWPQTIRVDDTAIYWVLFGNNANDGAVMRLAK
jgi:hypothetical protein